MLNLHLYQSLGSAQYGCNQVIICDTHEAPFAHDILSPVGVLGWLYTLPVFSEPKTLTQYVVSFRIGYLKMEELLNP